jgi:hypothetical protein
MQQCCELIYLDCFFSFHLKNYKHDSLQKLADAEIKLKFRSFSFIADSNFLDVCFKNTFYFLSSQDVLTVHAGLLFITLGAQLVNDDSPECRKMVAHCIKTMLERLETNACNQLFDIIIVWLKDRKVYIYI